MSSGSSLHSGPTAWGQAATQRFGVVLGPIVVAAAGVLAVLVVGLPLGVWARASQDGIDTPVDTWIADHVGDGVITRQMEKISILGDIPMTQVLGLIGALVLAFAFRRRWWIPLIVVGFGYLAERKLQVFLAEVIDRGAPAGETGTYPSGGVGRPLAVYGAILACALILVPAMSAARRRVLYIGLLLTATLIGVSRMWLGKHWLSDVIAAFPFGLLLLATVVALAASLTTDRAESST